MLPGRLRYLASFGGKIVGTFVIAAIFFLTSCGSSGGSLLGNSTPRPLPSAPSISAITPASGPTSGGTAVTITVAHLQSGASVTFAGVTATSVTYAHTPQPTDVFHGDTTNGTGMEGTLTSIGRLTAVTPPGNAGKADVVVINPDGQSATRPYGFTYTAPPLSISGVTPSSGSPNGGTALDPGTPLVALSPSAVAPGTLSVSNVFPDSCVSVGGCQVSITGTNFAKGMTVSFGGVSATSVDVNSSVRLTATVPPGDPGQSVSVNVKVSPTESATWSGSFRYGTMFVSDNFSSGDFSNWNGAIVGQPDTAGDHIGTPLSIVQGGQTTYDGTTTPTPPNGEANEAQIWYSFRQGTVSTSGTALTLVKGDPFNPYWRSFSNIAIGSTVGYGSVKVSGTSVIWLSGQKFATDGSWNGKTIALQGFGAYTISSVTSPTELTLVSSARTINETSYLAPSYTITSCSSTTSCTLTASAEAQTNVSYGAGSEDENIYFAHKFSAPYPDHVFVKGHVYLQAPTINGPWAGRKLIYEKTPGCGNVCGFNIFGAEVHANQSPNGTVNTNGTSVTWVSGSRFASDGSWNGAPFCIAGDCQYTVSSVADATDLTLSASAGIQTGATYASLSGAIQFVTDAGNHNLGTFPPSRMSQPWANFNQWYEIELETQLNTPGQANGYYNVWVDGQYRPDLSKSGIEFLTSGETEGFKWIEIGRQLDSTNAVPNRIVGQNEYRFWSDVAIGDAFIAP